MKAVGIIVEYNPMHNGHVYHIEEVRRISKCDVLIAVMSSSFTQRGEPAIIDKFHRTRFALNNGVDLVVELPFVFTVQSADIFALTSVSILHHLGVQEIYFGSESGNVEELEQLGDLLSSEAYNTFVKSNMKEGYSYPTANDMAQKEMLDSDAFKEPNNILGIQYILAGKELNSAIKFHTIKRIHSGYYDKIHDSGSVQSATAIRDLLTQSKDISQYVPKDVSDACADYPLLMYNDFSVLFQTIFARTTATELSHSTHVSEGLEHRLLSAWPFESVDDLIEQVLTRRYTYSRIKRTLAHILCNVTKSDIPSTTIPYIRVLGMNPAGQSYLNTIKHDLDVPLYTKIKEGLHAYLDIELRVTKVCDIVREKPLYTEEFKPVIF